MASGPARRKGSTGERRAPLPMRYCAVYDCLNTYKTHPQLTFFRFPHDKARMKLWTEKIRRPDILQSDGRVSTYYRVCETHFLPRDINPNPQRRRLLKKAVPCLRLPHDGPYVSVVELGAPPAPFKIRGRTLVRSSLEVFEYVDQTPKQKTKKQCEHIDRKPTIPVTAPQALEGFFTDCDRYLIPSMAEFVKIVAQLRQANDSRFNDLCLKLLHSNPPAYHLLRNTLALPNVATLHRHCAHLLPDFNTRLTDLLKTRVNRMTKEEKSCTLSVDFISVRPHLYYNITFDRIVGLHEVDGSQNSWPATHVVVVTARGLLADWTQPVALCFLARPDEAFDRWIEKIIRLLQAIGLVVHGLVWDPMTTLHLKQKISPERPFFKVDDTKIHFVYDPPRLMKMLLCKFLTHDFYFEKMMASWSDVVKYRKMEKHKPLTLTPGLTDADVLPGAAWSMRPAHAARLLSPALAAALSSYADRELLPDTARGTIKLILKINNLYAILSSTTKRTSSEFKQGLGQDPAQIGFLEYMKSFFKSLELKDRYGPAEFEAKRLTDCWQITIEAVLALRKESEAMRPCLPTRRLHMDDRISETARGRGCKPTGRQIFAAFKKHFFNDMLITPGKETSVDLNTLLAKIVSDVPTRSLDSGLEEEKVRMSDYRHLRLPRRGAGAVAMAARHLLRAALREHGDCEHTQRYAAAPPTADFLQLVGRLDEALVSTLRSGGPARALARELLLDVHVLDCELPCACFPLDRLKRLFLRLRLYRLLRHNQARFKNATDGDELTFEVNTLE